MSATLFIYVFKDVTELLLIGPGSDTYTEQVFALIFPSFYA
jgi:hypothetical protein